MANHVTDSRLGWGILGPGRIAHSFATGLARSEQSRLVAAGSRDQAKARAFLDEFAEAAHGAETIAHGSYDDLLADDRVQAVYIATPHPIHARWAIAAARAGKHVLVEKPVTVNRYQAMAVFEAARQHDVFAMEAYMYRFHPQTAKLVELISSGAIGEVLAVQSSFAYRGTPDPTSRTFGPALAGGGILDVGGYPASMALLVAGAALGVSGEAQEFATPSSITAGGTLGQTVVDEWSVANLTFDSGMTATLTTGVGLSDLNTTTILGSAGKIHLPNPRQPGRAGRMPG